jgi:hypothetical protein
VLPGGFLLMAAGFVVVALALPAAPSGVAGLLPAVTFVVLLTVGEMVVLPLARDLVPQLARERRLGTHYGALASFGGLAVLAGSAVLGAVIQFAPPVGVGIVAPWLVAAVVPVTSAFAVRRVVRRLPTI